MLLVDDQLDLLVTAAARWGIYPSDTAAGKAGLQAFGSALRGANLASEQALARIGRLEGRDMEALALAGRDYVFIEVDDPYEPVDVLKAGHAALQMCHRAPQWSSSHVHQVLEMLITAAGQRMPGYDTAPWTWQRREKITPAIGFAGTDPQVGIPGLVWVDGKTLQDCWDSAIMIVLTPSALEVLDPTLPERRDLVVLTTTAQLDEQQWQLVSTLGPAHIVDHNVGLPWLSELLEKMNRYVSQPAG